jgi:hypothetical protein
MPPFQGHKGTVESVVLLVGWDRPRSTSHDKVWTWDAITGLYMTGLHRQDDGFIPPVITLDENQ